jgi:hypothetical protein
VAQKLLIINKKANEAVTMNEKRQFERFDINVPVRIALPDSKKEEKSFSFEADNLSAGGLFFKPVNTLPEGRHIKMEIIFHFDELKTEEDPDGALIIAVTGCVQRSGPEGTAICFLGDYDVSASLDFLEKKHAGQPT